MMSKKPDVERDEKGRSIITKPFLRKLCEYQNLYETPALNTHLYLHFMGFTDIRNLDDYINLRALWLESNLINKIQGLENLTKLRCVYLQNNGIKKIENLDTLKDLITLNLSHNYISLIENIGGLTSLEDLDMSHNYIAHSHSLKGLKEAGTIKALDLNTNLIEDSESLIETFQALPELRCLYMKGNKCLRNILNYRKNFIAKLPSLTYLDEKPVTEIERLSCETWLLHGKEAEIEVRKNYFENKQAENKKSLDEYGEIEKQAIEKRKQIKKQIEENRDSERQKIAEARKKILLNQNSKIDALLEELNEKEKVLNEPIDENKLIPFLIKPGSIRYETGDFDDYGNRIATPDPEPLKDLKEILFDTLEELLINYEFDFSKVYDSLSGEYDCTEDSIRMLWFEYTNSLNQLNELE
jgi:dynein assembly factor 1, axonemal